MTPAVAVHESSQSHGIEVSPITVVVVDDHELLRAGTRQILDDAEGFQVIGEAGGGEQALRVVGSKRPQLVLMDIRLPDANGIDVARRLLARDPSPIVLILSAYDDEHYLQAALAAGVSGYLSKTLPGRELIAQIRRACRDPRNRPTVFRAFTGTEFRSSAHLTLRESEVVRLVAQGLPNKQIARRLEISPRTVEGHLNRVFDKVRVDTRTELAHYALVHGLLTRDQSELDGWSDQSQRSSPIP